MLQLFLVVSLVFMLPPGLLPFLELSFYLHSVIAVTFHFSLTIKLVHFLKNRLLGGTCGIIISDERKRRERKGREKEEEEKRKRKGGREIRM
jgi:hypothetical protein